MAGSIGNIWIECRSADAPMFAGSPPFPGEDGMLNALTARNEWKFFAVLPRADRGLAVAWWALLVLRGVLPALFAIAIGVFVGAVQRSDNLVAPLALVAAVFVPLQVLPPIHQAVGALLGSRLAAWL